MAPALRSLHSCALLLAALGLSAISLASAANGANERLVDGLESLRSDMSAMMADDGMEDEDDTGARGGFLQQSGSNSGVAGSAEYTAASAEALSAALGPRWNGMKLEAEANKKTNALLEGIRGHRGLSSSFMAALP
eukprot:TRINITY_DN62760_c0_g1_i1.p3 TRINITY_DN62760_c0_g1~~TRINITY_DN62760_c0_g1_i1.p3  ORF type:complete len:136 (+),score=34.10 TRINITY_DN62760_c0_g1_i1:68-475(+)